MPRHERTTECYIALQIISRDLFSYGSGCRNGSNPPIQHTRPKSPSACGHRSGGAQRCRFRRPASSRPIASCWPPQTARRADFGTIRPQSRLPCAMDRPEIWLADLSRPLASQQGEFETRWLEIPKSIETSSIPVQVITGSRLKAVALAAAFPTSAPPNSIWTHDSVRQSYIP